MQQKMPEKQPGCKLKASSIYRDSNFTTRQARVDVGLVEKNPGCSLIAAGCFAGLIKMPGRAAQAGKIPAEASR